jgi:hypothetical protein
MVTLHFQASDTLQARKMSSVIIENGVEVIVIDDECTEVRDIVESPEHDEVSSKYPIDRNAFIENKSVEEVNEMHEKKLISSFEFVKYHKGRIEKKKKEAFLKAFDFKCIHKMHHHYKPSTLEYLVKALYGDDFKMDMSFL